MFKFVAPIIFTIFSIVSIGGMIYASIDDTIMCFIAFTISVFVSGITSIVLWSYAIYCITEEAKYHGASMKRRNIRCLKKRWKN